MRSMKRVVHASALLSLALAAACATLPVIGRPATERWAFSAPWDPRSAASVAAHGPALDVVVSGWIALDTATGAPALLYRDSTAATARTRFALLTSYAADRFRPELVRTLAADTAALARTAGGVALLLARGGYRGVVVDFEGHTPGDLSALLRVVNAVADSARGRGVTTVAVAVPAADTAGYPARPFLDHADLVLVMLYDQHWSGSTPGSIAAPDWVRQRLGTRVAEVGPNRIVAALPVYGYRWPIAGVADVIGYADAVRLAGVAGVQLVREPSTLELHAARSNQWELWAGDAETLRGLRAEVERSGVRRVALWRLGLEDPQIWSGSAPGR